MAKGDARKVYDHISRLAADARARGDHTLQVTIDEVVEGAGLHGPTRRLDVAGTLTTYKLEEMFGLRLRPLTFDI